MMMNSDPYAERTVCSCLISNPYMSNWNSAQGSYIGFFFFYFFTLKCFLCLYSGPCAWIWRRTIRKTARKSEVASTDLHCWDRLGECCKFVFVPNPCAGFSMQGKVNWLHLLLQRKKITGQIVCVGGQKHTPCKVWYPGSSLSLWKRNAHLPSGKICFLWRSDPAEFQVPRAQGRVSLKAAHTEVSLLCSMVLNCL